MSKCIIQIKIGDNIITLDPNADINSNDGTTLTSAIDVVKLRSLFSSLKEDVDLSKIVSEGTPEEAFQGEMLYSNMKKNSPTILTPLAALQQVTRPEEKVAMRAFIANLDSTQIHQSGDFYGEPENAYKLSPYSIGEVQSLFNKDSNELSLFKELMSIPGMSTLRVSIAIKNDLNGQPLTSAKGMYLTPDNIVQIYVPPSYHLHTANQDRLTVQNFERGALEDIRNNILHETTHAVYSELYLSNDAFKDSVDLIHQAFTSAMAKSANTRDNALGDAYKDVHEFIADIFVSKKLRNAMSKLDSLEGKTELEHGTLYNTFIRSLSDKLRGADKLLTQAVSLLDTSVPTKYIGDTFDTVVSKELGPDRQSVFFSDGIDQVDINERTAPRDAVDSYGGVNAQAFWIQEAFNKRHDVVDNKYTIRDAYYAASVENPTPAQLDRLYKQDLVKIPWVRYQVGNAENVTGRWVEQGVITKNGKDLLKGGKLQTVDITRNEQGQILQNSKLGTITERTKLVPVVYTNSKTGKVVVAKTGLAQNDKNGFNTVSFPYDMIKGYRKYNSTYFNHNEDFEGELKELRKERAVIAAKGDSDDRTDGLARIDRAIVNTEAAINEAGRIVDNMMQYHAETAFSHKSPETNLIKMEVTKEDYMNSNFKKDDIEFRQFVPIDRDVPPLYVINKDKDGKFRSRPNPAVFRTLWDGGSGSAFVIDSESVSEAVSRGDMIRVGVKMNIEQDGEQLKIERNEWFPVYQRLPNGIEVATAKGKGMIIPFNKIDAYAKNMHTEDFINLVDRVENLQETFEDNLYSTVVDTVSKKEKRVYNKEYAKDGIKYSALQFNKDYNVTADEAVEDAIKRFDKNQGFLRNQIIPYESFVKVKRKYFDANSNVIGEDGKPTGRKGAVREHQTNDLVVAKTNDGLVIMNGKGKFLRFEYIAYNQSIDDKVNTGSELAFLMQDISATRKVWDEFQSEKDSYDKVKDAATFVNEGTESAPKWRPAFDFGTQPRNNRDVYDFYDNADGVKIARLRRGDVIGIRAKEGANMKAPYYYRKVVSVHEDGNVTVAEHANKDVTTKTGFTIKAGPYPRTVNAKDVMKVGYKKTEMRDGKQELREDLLSRRGTLLEYANKDKDKQDFDFASAERAEKFNAKIFKSDGQHKRFVPFTEAVLKFGQKDSDGIPYLKGNEGDKIYLNKKLNPIPLNSDGYPLNRKDMVYVMAWFSGDNMVNTVTGMAANTTTFKADDITKSVGNYKKIHPEVMAELMPGDWAVRKYKGKNGEDRWWSALIDRIEGGNIYVINKDFTTSPLSMDGLTSIKTSRRNDKFTGFTRTDKLKGIIKTLQQAKAPIKKDSLQAEYKSPADSTRAIYEVGSRFQKLNPDVTVNYLSPTDIEQIRKNLGFDYGESRAFILNGEVNVNMQKASVSDLIHEYAHLFLHALKYENTEMYNSITNMTLQHPLYNRVATTYNHLEGEDLNEEVFVTVLGEYLNNQLKKQDENWMAGKKDIILNFAEYTKRKLSQTMNQEVSGLYDLDSKDILTMNFEDVINLVGDEVMKNRISNLYDAEVKFNRSLVRLKQDLMERNQLKQECYG